jgi:transposase
MKKELYIGLDVHKDSITVATAQGGRDGEVRLYGTISNDLQAIEMLLTRLRKAHGANPRIELSYEAGPCGFVIARRMRYLQCLIRRGSPSANISVNNLDSSKSFSFDRQPQR